MERTNSDFTVYGEEEEEGRLTRGNMQQECNYM